MAKKTSNDETKLFIADYLYSHCETVFLHVVFIPFYTIGIGVQCLCFHISMMAFSYTHVTNLGLFIDGRIGFSLSCHNKNKNIVIKLLGLVYIASTIQLFLDHLCIITNMNYCSFYFSV